MGRRALSRHRAPLRPSTPFTHVTSAMSGGAATIGRGGVAIAMSTGLAASVGIPTTASAGQPKATVAPSAEAAGLLTALDGELARSASVTASASARVDFDATAAAFTAAPKPKAAPAPAPARSTKTSRTSTRTPAPSENASGVLAIAARYVGVPYVYGGESPSGFDCSGYTQYVFKQVGISLPRTANEQLNATTRISRSDLKLGDLVFFLSGGRAYHVGIYAGNGMIYDSPKPGKVVNKREIWGSTLAYGRP